MIRKVIYTFMATTLLVTQANALSCRHNVKDKDKAAFIYNELESGKVDKYLVGKLTPTKSTNDNQQSIQDWLSSRYRTKKPATTIEKITFYTQDAYRFNGHVLSLSEYRPVENLQLNIRQNCWTLYCPRNLPQGKNIIFKIENVKNNIAEIERHPCSRPYNLPNGKMIEDVLKMIEENAQLNQYIYEIDNVF